LPREGGGSAAWDGCLDGIGAGDSGFGDATSDDATSWESGCFPGATGEWELDGIEASSGGGDATRDGGPDGLGALSFFGFFGSATRDGGPDGLGALSFFGFFGSATRDGGPDGLGASIPSWDSDFDDATSDVCPDEIGAGDGGFEPTWSEAGWALYMMPLSWRNQHQIKNLSEYVDWMPIYIFFFEGLNANIFNTPC